MRSIGSNCHSLLKISLAHAKAVTDVGLASLTVGCPALRHIDLHGVCLLACDLYICYYINDNTFNSIHTTMIY